MTKKLKRLVTGFLAAAVVTAAVGVAVAQTDWHVVAPHSTNVHQIYGYAGIPISIEVEGDGSTDLDLYAYDENGRRIARDADRTDYCLADWTPRWNGPFSIVVVNRGSDYNEYRFSIVYE